MLLCVSYASCCWLLLYYLSSLSFRLCQLLTRESVSDLWVSFWLCQFLTRESASDSWVSFWLVSQLLTRESASDSWVSFWLVSTASDSWVSFWLCQFLTRESASDSEAASDSVSFGLWVSFWLVSQLPTRESASELVSQLLTLSQLQTLFLLCCYLVLLIALLKSYGWIVVKVWEGKLNVFTVEWKWLITAKVTASSFPINTHTHVLCYEPTLVLSNWQSVDCCWYSSV